MSKLKWIVVIVLLTIFIVPVSLDTKPRDGENVDFSKSPYSQTITPLSYYSANKYISGSKTNFEINTIQAMDDSNDKTTYTYSIENLKKWGVLSMTAENYEGSDLNSTLEKADRKSCYERWESTLGYRSFKFIYPPDHLSSSQKYNIISAQIEVEWMFFKFATAANTVIECNNLTMQVIMSDGQIFHINIQYELRSEIWNTKTMNLSQQCFIDCIKNGGYIKEIQFTAWIQAGWFYFVALNIDVLKITYICKTNFNLDIQYDLFLMNRDLNYISVLNVIVKYSSAALCTVSILSTTGIPLVLGSFTNTNGVTFTITNPQYLRIVDGWPYVISLKFTSSQQYITNNFPFELDYIGIEYDENNPPSLNVITPNPAGINYLNYIPNFIVEASDASDIQSVVVKHFSNSFPMSLQSGNVYQLSSTDTVWRNYYNNIVDSAYVFQVIANDSHYNSRIVDITIVKDTTKPQLSFIDLPAHASSVAPGIHLYINELNLETNWISIQNSTETLTTYLTWLEPYWVLDASCSNWASYQAFWQGSQDSAILYTASAIDKANNQNQTSQIVQKDTTAPQISFIAPSNQDEIKFTPIIIMDISDPTIDMNSVKLNSTYQLQYDPFSLNWFRLSTNSPDWAAWDNYFRSVPIGPVVLNVSASDLLGHLSFTAITIFKIDNTPPTIIPLSNDTYWHKDPVSVYAYVEDYNLDSIWYCIDENLVQYPVNTTISSIVWNSLSDGIHTITIFANDTSSNIAIIEYTLKIDRNAPVIVSYSPAHLSAFNQPPPLSAIVNDVQTGGDLTIFYEIGGQKFYMQNNTPIQMNQAIWDSYSTGSYITISINATDSLNFSSKIEFSILKDILPPVIQINTLNYTVFYEAVTEISYSANEEISLTISYNGTIINWNYKWPALPYGLHIFQLNFTDRANNIVGRELRLYKNDSIVPVLIINYPQTGDFAGEQPPMVSISAFDLTLKRIIYIVGTDVFMVPFTPGLTSVDLVFTIDTTAWDNAYNETTTIRIIAIDSYGNAQEVQVTLIRSDFAGAHSKKGLGLGLFLDMPLEMYILLFATFGITLLIQYSIDKRRKTLR